MKIFWVETALHDTDWFITANDWREAEQLHTAAIGQAEGLALALYVRDVPEDLPSRKGIASPWFLQACGAKCLSWTFPRVVEIDRERFCQSAGPDEPLATEGQDSADRAMLPSASRGVGEMALPYFEQLSPAL